MPRTRGRILVVDDDDALARFVVELLVDTRYEAEHVSSAHEAIRRLDNSRWDVVVTDMRMPGMSGLDLAVWLRRWRPELAVIAITAFGLYDAAELATRAGAVRCINKPFAPDELLAAVASCLPRPNTTPRAPDGFTERGRSR